MKKEKLLAELETGIEIGTRGINKSLPELELGGTLIYISTALESNPELFNDPEVTEKMNVMVEKLAPVIQKHALDYEGWGWRMLKKALNTGKELFPDRDKHWWWWWPEQFIDDEHLEKWRIFSTNS